MPGVLSKKTYALLAAGLALACTRPRVPAGDQGRREPTPTRLSEQAIQDIQNSLPTPPASNAWEWKKLSRSSCLDAEKPSAKNRLGVRSVKVVAGAAARAEAYPFAVAISLPGSSGPPRPYCAGSLIGPRALLTAAHCHVQPGHIAVINQSDLSTHRGETRTIGRVITHPRFNSATFENDIAVLHLEQAVSRNASEHSLPIATLDAPVGACVTAVGWSAASAEGPSSTQLFEATVPVVSQQECASLYANRYAIVNSMLCASAPGSRDACQADGGGPLVVKDARGSMTQVGITSFGTGCAQAGSHGVYTRVSAFTTWINQHLSP